MVDAGFWGASDASTGLRSRTRPARRPPKLPGELVPNHVAIVMDGNGRWAKERGLPRTEGHKVGEGVVLDVLKGCLEIGVKNLSLYAFSTENWKRSPDEVRFLMNFNRDVIRRRRDEMDELGIRIRWVGRMPKMWKSVVQELQVAQEQTKDNDAMTLYFCVNYGGRAEIADAAKAHGAGCGRGAARPRQGQREDLREVPRTTRTCRTSTSSCGPAASSAPPTTCSGRAATPSWSSRTSCGRTSTAATCGGPAWSSPPATGGSAALSRGAAAGVLVAPRPGPGPRTSPSYCWEPPGPA